MEKNRPPPLLLFATLAFWGWQTDFLVAGVIMGMVLESGRWINTRWDFSDDDFRRIWTFCALVLLAATVYAFTSNEGVRTSFAGLLSDPSLRSQRNAGTSTAHAVASLVRWLPMVFFLFVGAQVFSLRNGVPLETISLIMRRRWRRARKRGKVLPPGKVVNVCYPYLGLCLLAASVHPEEDKSYFWGLCVLLGWAMWPHRSKRGGLAPWAAAMAVAITVGYFGQIELSRLQRYVETLNVLWFTGGGNRGTQADETKTAIGQIGHIKTSTAIVIRLEPLDTSPPPTLLREASYRRFGGRNTWSAGENTREDFVHVPETNDTSYLLLPRKQDRRKVTVSCYLPGGNGLLPLPQPASRLDHLFVYNLEKNPAGALRAQGPGMVIFNASYGSGASIDSDPEPIEDLDMRLRDVPAVEEAIKQMKISGTNHLEILNAVAGFFSANFGYQTWQDQPPLPEPFRNGRRGGMRGGSGAARTNQPARFPGRNIFASSTNHEEAERELAMLREHLGESGWETPLERFLLKSRKGHCEYFATATVLILRKLGIPARYAVGYAVHEGSGNKYVVRQRDAHAWCLVWNAEKRAWEDFDTTPASWVEAEDAHGAPFRALQDFWSDVKFLFAKLWWGQSHLRQYLLYALFPLLCFLLYQILFRTRRKRRQGDSKLGPNVAWPGLDSEFYQLEQKLAERGLRRQPSESLSAWMASLLAEPGLAESNDTLRRLLALHYRYRFDPAGLNPGERESLSREARACLASL